MGLAQALGLDALASMIFFYVLIIIGLILFEFIAHWVSEKENLFIIKALKLVFIAWVSAAVIELVINDSDWWPLLFLPYLIARGYRYFRDPLPPGEEKSKDWFFPD